MRELPEKSEEVDCLSNIFDSGGIDQQDDFMDGLYDSDNSRFGLFD